MATPTTAAAALLSREHLRTFHLSGQGLEDSIPADALRPTILATLKHLPDLETFYPLCVHSDGSALPFRELVEKLEHAGIIVSAFRSAMHGRPAMPLEQVAPAAIDSLTECSKPEIAQLRKLLPTGAVLVAFQADSLLLLHAAALAESRRAQRIRFWQEVKLTAARLREILLLDEANAPGAITTESVTASLGSGMDVFFNSALLAKALQSPKNPLRRMDPARRARCEKTLATLEDSLADAANLPAFWVFHSGILGSTGTPPDVVLFHGEAKWAVDSFAAALHFCDLSLNGLTQVLRALRMARLEIDSTFDPSIHDETLARFDWQSASAAELNALPPIMVVETAGDLGQTSLTSFGRLLRSGRPIQVLIVRTGLDPAELTEFSPDFGYLSIAHREAFVLQSSMAQPSHLLPGLKSMAKSLRPAVAVVSGAVGHFSGLNDERQAWLEQTLLIWSRTFSLFSYDPDAGPRWVDRFRLLPMTAKEGLTPVHAAAFSSDLRLQFRLVPASAWDSEQMELAQYLEAYTDRPPLAIPYIWVEGSKGAQQRALLTRDLANFCIDRRRSGEHFEELAELGKPLPAPDEKARQEGAREAIQRVIGLLTAS